MKAFALLGLACAAAYAQDPPQHDHAAMGHETPQTQQQQQPAREAIPPVTDADRAAAFPPVHGHAHDRTIHYLLQMQRLEAWDADAGTGASWDATGWIGSDVNRIWLRSEGENVDGRTQFADVELMYGRAAGRWWDLLAGVRHDFGAGPARTFAGIGVLGLLPYGVEIEATAYVGEGGRTAARFEAEYEVLLTNRLILQPLVEAELYGEADAPRGIGAGIATLEAGLRLRYEVTRRFAPYVGLTYERAFADTADLRRLAGEHTSDTRVVAGVRTWF